MSQNPAPAPSRPRRPAGVTLSGASTFREVLIAARDSGKPYEVSVSWAGDPEVCVFSRVENDFVVLTVVEDGDQVFVRIEDVRGIYVTKDKVASEPAGEAAA